MHSGIPAVAVGGSLNALGVIRSLSQGHMPLFVVETTRQAAACWSRYCRFVTAPSLNGAPLVNTPVELGTRLRSRPVLILASDESVDTISAARSEIETLYRISLPSAKIVQALADKTKFQLLAEGEGFRVPRGVAVSNIDDCALIRLLTAPVVLKPADKTLVLADIAERAVRADTPADAEQVAHRMLRQAPRLIVQEWIDGPETTLCGINLPLLTYRAAIGLPNPAPPSLSAESAAWRASLAFRPPLGFLGPRTKLVDGFLGWIDPLPAVYHYAYDRGVRRVWRRAKRAVSRWAELTSKQEA